MDTRQLQAFICVFEERSITGASRRLCITQPAVSSTIKQLEEFLGACLFVRRPRGVEVTEQARTLYPHVQKLLADADAMARLFTRSQKQQELKLGVEDDIGGEEIKRCIDMARLLSPAIQLNLEQGCSGDIRLGTEELRCEDELFIPFKEDPWVLAVPDTHRLAGIERINRQELPTDEWVICPGQLSHQRLLPLYGNGTLSPAATAQTYKLALNLVSAGVGMALAPQTLVVAQSGVKNIAVHDLQLSRRIGICYSIKAMENPLTSTFCCHLQAQLRQDSFSYC